MILISAELFNIDRKLTVTELNLQGFKKIANMLLFSYFYKETRKNKSSMQLRKVFMFRNTGDEAIYLTFHNSKIYFKGNCHIKLRIPCLQLILSYIKIWLKTYRN